MTIKRPSKKVFTLESLVSGLLLVLSVLFIGNAINNFLRYTDLYKFTRPLWIKQFFLSHQSQLFPEQWAMDVKKPSNSQETSPSSVKRKNPPE